MVESAHGRRIRLLSFCCGLLLGGILLAASQPALASTPPPDGGGGADVSMINGKVTNVRDWPWQVALVGSGPGSRRVSARKRYFCAGSLIAPDLVITAAHCVANLRRSQVRRIQVISGRTWLSNRSGSSAWVKRRLMPTYSSGRRKFASGGMGPSWDVALLKLKRELPGTPIKLAGATEASSWSEGGLVRTIGWGVTASENRLGSNVLRIANQVVLPDAVCARDNGRGYQPKTMICIGGPAGNTSTCFGDSGGPMVARVSTGWRLVGVTSFGDPYCSPNYPSVDTRVAGRAIRAWVRGASLRASGVDPLGAGGVAQPKRKWCRVPKLPGRTVSQARTALVKAGCRLGKVRSDFYGYGRIGRTSASSLPQGWLTPIGNRIGIWVNR